MGDEGARDLPAVFYDDAPLADPNELARAMPLLRAVPYEELVTLPAERVVRDAGELFFEQGAVADAYGILTGRVQIMKRTLAGRELCLEVLGPGDLVGAVAVVRKIPMPAAAVAVEATACLKVPADAFRATMERHPQVAMRMLDVISRRLVEAGASRLELATEDVETRVARALIRLAEKYGSERGGEVIFTQSLTRQNLADLAGTTVESAIRVMSRWTRQGIVKSTAKRITILDPPRLRELAGKR